MNASYLINQFAKVGVRARLRPLIRPRFRQRSSIGLVIDVGRDGSGEFFDLQAEETAQIEVLDVQPRDRHLLLMVRTPSDHPHQPDEKDKFLCGHDERHWFVAGVPSDPGVSGVTSAKQALKPQFVHDLETGRGRRRTRRGGRKTDVFIRQGEWFFVDAPHPPINPKWVLRNEPLTRGRGKPHLCEYLYRVGGETVYVSREYPLGLTAEQYRAVMRDDRKRRTGGFRTMVRDPAVYVRGKVSHSDHATIHLDDWRQVVMNTEQRSRVMESIAFLD